MKLINDPKYKKGKSVTDSLANAFYTENQTDAMMVWLGLIEQFPDELLDQARFDVK